MTIQPMERKDRIQKNFPLEHMISVKAIESSVKADVHGMSRYARVQEEGSSHWTPSIAHTSMKMVNTSESMVWESQDFS